MLVASILPPVQISHVMMPRGVDRLYLNFNYILTGEDGIIYPPKDDQRMRDRPGAIAGAFDAPQRVLQDVTVMADAGYPMSPAWLRQMGREAEAQVVEAQIANTEAQNAAVTCGRCARQLWSYRTQKPSVWPKISASAASPCRLKDRPGRRLALRGCLCICRA
jgi:hypothetical protein